MSRFIYTNNASTTLRVDFPSGPPPATLNLALGTGDRFPQPSGVELFEVTLENVAGEIETAHCSSRSGDDVTVVARAQGNTLENNWVSGDRAECRPTAEGFTRALQRQDDSLLGELDANNNSIVNVIIQGGEVRNADLMNAAGGTDNNINVPTGDATPTIGGNAIWHTGNIPYDDPSHTVVPGMIMMWHSSVAPPGWALCDGRNVNGGPVSPDLRGRFVFGYNSGDAAYPEKTGVPTGSTTVGSIGGSYTRTSSENGTHNHTGTSGGTAITIEQMPSHLHDAKSYHDESSNGGFTNGGRDSMFTQQTELTGGLNGVTQEHTHPIGSEDTTHQHTLDETEVVPYMVLAFIIKLNSNQQVPA